MTSLLPEARGKNEAPLRGAAQLLDLLAPGAAWCEICSDLEKQVRPGFYQHLSSQAENRKTSETTLEQDLERPTQEPGVVSKFLRMMLRRMSLRPCV